MNPKLLSLLTLAAASCAASTSVDILARDSFEYGVNNALDGHDGGTGFAGPYTATPVVIVPGLEFGSHPSAGNAASVGLGHSASRPLSFNPSAGSTFWTSFVLEQNASEIVGASTTVTLSGTSGADTLGSFSWKVTSVGGYSQPVLEVESGGDGGTYGFPEVFERAGPKLFVTKFENWNSGGPGVFQQATVWIFDEAEYATVAFPVSTENDLIFSTSTGPTASAQFPFFSGSSMSLSIANADRAVTFDEFRLGTSLADVMPSPVPEPRHVALAAGLALCGFAFLRRFRPKAA